MAPSGSIFRACGSACRRSARTLAENHPRIHAYPMKKILVKLCSKLINGLRLWGHGQHKRNIAKSKAILKRLSGLEHDGQALAYLRKIDPYIFEELTLTLLEARGIFVLRSASYSNDGGIDGRFFWPGRGWHAVQCKRYGKSITPSHAREFSAICAAKFSGGLFVHTGRTGDQSQEALTPPGLCILSGSDLARCARDRNADPLALSIARKARQSSRAVFMARQNSAPSASPSRSRPAQAPRKIQKD